jgi:hypothetical protein
MLRHRDPRTGYPDEDVTGALLELVDGSAPWEPMTLDGGPDARTHPDRGEADAAEGGRVTRRRRPWRLWERGAPSFEPEHDETPDVGSLSWAGLQSGNIRIQGLALRPRDELPEEPSDAPARGRRFEATVFDEVVMGASPVLTSPDFDALLGSENALGLEVFVNRVTGGGTPAMTVDVLHSSDRHRWVVSHSGVVAFWISTAGPSWFWAPVAATPVGLAFRQLRITLIPVGATGPLSAEVSVHACGRSTR